MILNFIYAVQNNLVWHSYDFRLPWISIEEIFNNSATFLLLQKLQMINSLQNLRESFLFCNPVYPLLMGFAMLYCKGFSEEFDDFLGDQNYRQILIWNSWSFVAVSPILWKLQDFYGTSRHVWHHPIQFTGFCSNVLCIWHFFCF